MLGVEGKITGLVIVVLVGRLVTRTVVQEEEFELNEVEENGISVSLERCS